jgi:hypothetical protein
MPNHRFYALLVAGILALIIIASMITECVS